MATNSASSTPPIEKVIANIRNQTEIKLIIKVVAIIKDSDEEAMIKTYVVVDSDSEYNSIFAIEM